MSFIKRLFNFFKAQSSQENQYTEPLHTPTCPTCNINLGTRVVDDIPLSVCEKCNGIWVSELDFPDLIHEDERKLEKLFHYTEENLKIRFDYMSPGAVRKCPVCPHFMMNVQFDYSSGIWLDHCPNNHGVWLDAGEINLVINYHKKSQEPASVMTEKPLPPKKIEEEQQPNTCPTCKVHLTAKFMDNNLFFLTCEKCSGLWVTHENLAELTRRDEKEIDKFFKYTEENLKIRLDYMKPSAVRKCPECLKYMMNVQFDVRSGIWLDHCPDDHGVWLDAGEIDLVIQYKRQIRELGCQKKTADLIGSLRNDEIPESSLPCCPTCKVVLELKNIEKTSLLFCNHCNGIWVDNENFKNLLKMEELDLQNFFSYTDESLNVKLDYMKPGAIRRCPECHKHMMNIQFDASSGIWLDHCIDEHGVWLDAGEINLVREYQRELREGRAPNLHKNK
jgi:Zn-finger nucleic acid-binding protein